MTREPWMQPAEERGSFRRISGGDRRQSNVSGGFPIRAGSKVESQGSDQPQPEASLMNAGPVTTSTFLTASRHGSMLGSLKAYYRKLRTFKGTVRALINLKRTPFSLVTNLKPTTPTGSGDGRRRSSALLEVPRISATDASAVQTQVHKLVAEGHIIAEIDPTSGTEVTYRQQGNLDHYTEDNLAKRVSLQQHPRMIALTQRLWNCALHNGEKKFKFADYERYMLCLHRLILPEFDIAASKELILDDWKRDSGEQDHLDYAFFHLSMFELVDLWTDTVDPEDYISLLYCITHCLTYLLNDCHKLKSLEDVSNVDILKESKGVTLEGIKQDLQRELNSDAFAYYRDQVKLAAAAKQNIEQGTHSPRRDSRSQQGGSQMPPRSRSRDRRRSSSRSGERDSTIARDTESTTQRRRSRSGSATHGQDSPNRKFSVQTRANALNLTADTSGMISFAHDRHVGSDRVNGGPPPLTAQNFPSELKQKSPRRETGIQRMLSPNVFTRGGGVILNIGMMDGIAISKSIADAVSTTSGMAAFPRRRSRSASNSSQHRREQIMQAVSGNVESAREATNAPGLQVNHIEASGTVLRTSTQDTNAPGYLLIPGSSVKSREPFTVRAAAVAEAAANMAAPANHRQALALQRTQHLQQRTFADGTALAVQGGATKNSPANFSINNSSLTAPLMTIVSSKAPTPREATSSINKIQLNFQESSDPNTTRPETPYGGLSGASISSPRASNAITAQAAGIFISSQQRTVKPPTSPRPTILQRPGSILSSEYQTPTSPRKLQQRQQDDVMSLVATGPGSFSANPTSMVISGRPAAPNSSFDLVQRQPSKLDGHLGLLEDVPTVLRDGVTTPSQPKDDLKALLSPRYIVANPVVPHHPAQLSNLKQSSVRPQGSTRGFANAKTSPRIRHQPSSLANGPATQQHRQQQRPSELHGLAIAPGKLG